MPKMPQKRWAHAACQCSDQIFVVGGTSDLMLNMEMRSVPIGEPECYSFNIFTNKWRQLPDVPVGKIHPQLVPINNRFLYQIGGFDDWDFDIYRYDLQKPNKPWKVLTLDTSLKPMLNSNIFTKTKHYLEKQAEQNKNLKEGEERQSEDDSDFGTVVPEEPIWTSKSKNAFYN